MKLWCYLQIMINVQVVEIFIKKSYLLKIIQGWIRFMSEQLFYFFRVVSIVVIGFFVCMTALIIFGVLDGQEQKEKLSNMSCEELRFYLIDSALELKGFPQIAEKLFKYKCEVNVG